MNKLNRVNFDELLSSHVTRNSPDVEFVMKIAKQMQAEDKMSDLEIMKSLLEFLADQSRISVTNRLITVNKTISDSINELVQLERWSNLQSVAVSAMENAVSVVTKGGRRRILSSFKLKLAVLEASADQYEDMFKSEFLTEFLNEEKK